MKYSSWTTQKGRLKAARLEFSCPPPPGDRITHNAAEVAAHKDVVEGGQFQVGGPQVPGQLETFAVRNAAAPVRRAQWTRAGRSFIWRHR